MAIAFHTQRGKCSGGNHGSGSDINAERSDPLRREGWRPDPARQHRHFAEPQPTGHGMQFGRKIVRERPDGHARLGERTLHEQGAGLPIGFHVEPPDHAVAPRMGNT